MSLYGGMSATASVYGGGVAPSVISADVGAVEEALSHVAYALSDYSYLVLPVPFGQVLQHYVTSARRNVFDQVGKVSQSAFAQELIEKAYEASKIGQFVTLFASSPASLLPMVPTLYKLSSTMLPAVIHVVAKDHSDLMAVRQTGLVMLSSLNATETHDMALLAHVTSLKTNVPFLHFYDGDVFDNELQRISTSPNNKPQLVPYGKLAELIGLTNSAEFRQFALSKSAVQAPGSNELYFQVSSECIKRFNAIPQVLSELMAKVFGGKYKLFEYFGHEHATHLVIVTGTSWNVFKNSVESLQSNWNAKVGVLAVRLFRPWCIKSFLDAVPASVTSILVLDRMNDPTSVGEPLFVDVLQSFQSDSWQKETTPKMIGGKYGMDPLEEQITRNVVEDFASSKLSHGFIISSSVENASVLSIPSSSSSSFTNKPKGFEEPYLKMLNQLFGKRAIVANLVRNQTVWKKDEEEEFATSTSTSTSTSTTTTTTTATATATAVVSVSGNGNGNGNGSTCNSGIDLLHLNLEDNAAFGFGVHLGLLQKRHQLKEIVKSFVLEEEQRRSSSSSFSSSNSNSNSNSTNSTNTSSICSNQLVKSLCKWLEMQKNGNDTGGSDDRGQKMELIANEIVILLENEQKKDCFSSEKLIQIYELRSYLHQFSQWIIGSEEWTSNLGESGIHQVLSSGQNINLLILDTEPYSRIQLEQQKQQKRKRDIGLYAMQYGNAYVASVALYDSYSQVLRALNEADAFDGPSVILAYAPTNSSSSSFYMTTNYDGDEINPEEETKQAIASGYWPLYRYNPQLESKGEKAFALESISIKKELQDFLERSNQLSLFAKQQVETTNDHLKSGRSFTQSFDLLKQQQLNNSFEKLTKGLKENGILFQSDIHLMILVGSDNGHAEEIACKFLEEALKFGVTVTKKDMNEVSLEEITSEENILFVCSTAGQGEFPSNAKEFWNQLLVVASSISLGSIKFAVFGMGDSHYWPREDEKHYFCKAPKDLDEKLCQLGGLRLLPIALADDQDEDGPLTQYETWKILLWQSLKIPSEVIATVTSGNKKKKTNEDIKRESNYLRGTLATGLEDRSTKALCEADTQLTKFHGIYQQDNRDLREQMRIEKKEKAFSFMIRVRVPGGVSTPEQYIVIHDLSDSHANGNIKLTTRQAYQLQGILKWNLKPIVQGINRALMDSLAACGDVNRNVMASVNPELCSVELHQQVIAVSCEISTHLSPRTSAYHEIWLDKKLVAGGETKDFEPLYGETYLPRKFKIAMAVPPSNDVDVFAHCLGFIAITDPNEPSKLIGFNVTVGGGMGMTHNNTKTFPRLADVMAFCTVEQAKEVAEKVLLVQRDYGDRINRKHARFKYTVEDHGLPWIRAQVEERLGYQLQEARPYKFTSNGDRFGWHKMTNGKYLYTMFVEGGRIKDTEDIKIKTGLREIAELLRHDQEVEFRLTPNQNITIANIPNDKKNQVKTLLERYNFGNEQYSGMRLNAIACAALPFCGLAFAEAERYLPKLITRIEEILEENGLRDDAIVIRMTGCPNGCGRPYLGEIGLVGRAPGIYNLYLGAGFVGDRLNKLYKESVDEEAILKELRPVIKNYAQNRTQDEKFGDFVIRHGYVKACLAAPHVPERAPGDSFHA